MIGQNHLLQSFGNIKDNFPRFSIIVGNLGCGKKTLCKEIVKILKLTPVYFGTKIEDIRNAIDMAYTQVSPIIYIIPDADNMSLGAKNSLLKITEEPPKNTYFLMTLQSPDNTLETIRSRGTIFTLDKYSPEELIEYRVFKGYSSNYDDIVRRFCSSTGEVDELFKYDIDEFYKFANTIVNYIHIPTSGNTFKITKKMKLKDSDEGFEPYFLLKVVRQLYLEKGINNKQKEYLNASIVTGNTLYNLNKPSLNKLGLIDMWIMNVRRELMSLR